MRGKGTAGSIFSLDERIFILFPGLTSFSALLFFSHMSSLQFPTFPDNYSSSFSQLPTFERNRVIRQTRLTSHITVRTYITVQTCIILKSIRKPHGHVNKAVCRVKTHQNPAGRKQFHAHLSIVYP